jgi:hypothetical protein
MISMDKKYKTMDGDPVRILCVDGPGKYPVIGICCNSTEDWTIHGVFDALFPDTPMNLVEVSEWDDFKIDDPVMVRDREDESWLKGYFAGVKEGKPTTWSAGATSWSAISNAHLVYWNFCRKPTAEELGKK